jgi:hypothetical protein
MNELFENGCKVEEANSAAGETMRELDLQEVKAVAGGPAIWV